METLSFTLGVLSIIIAAFVAVTVWGIVKVVKQQKEIQGLESLVERLDAQMWRSLDELTTRIHQEYKEYKYEVDERFKESQRDLDRRISEIYQL